MKAVIDQRDLMSVLNCSLALSKRPARTSEAMIRLIVRDGLLSASAMGATMAIALSTEVKDSIDGMIDLPGLDLINIIKALPEQLTLETYAADIDDDEVGPDQSWLRVTTGNGVFTLAGYNDVCFDIGPDEKLPDGVFIDFGQFKASLSIASSFASQDPTKAILCGVWLGLDDESGLSYQATNGHILCCIDNVHQSDGGSYVIPLAAVNAIKKLNPEGGLTLRASGAPANVMEITGKGVFLKIQLLVGEYPQTERIFPQKFDIVSTVETSTLIDQLSRAKISARNNLAKLEFKEDTLKITSGRSDTESVQTMGSELQGDGLEICINIDYLLNALRATGDQAIIRMNDAVTPIVIETPGIMAKYLVMPVQIKP